MKHAPDAVDLATEQSITVEEADERIADMVGLLEWANLTRPLLNQMISSPHAWRSLTNIAVRKMRAKNGGQGGVWSPSTAAGSMHLRINPTGSIRSSLMLRSGPSSYGPDEMNGRNLFIDNIQLPEAVMLATTGMKFGDIVDSQKHFALISPNTDVKKLVAAFSGVKFTFNLAFIQPTPADLAAMRAANDPTAPR